MKEFFKKANEFRKELSFRLCLELIAAGLLYLAVPVMIVLPFVALLFGPAEYLI